MNLRCPSCECFPVAKAARRWRPGGSVSDRAVHHPAESFWKVGGFFGLSLMFFSVLSGCGSSVTETSQVAIWRTSKRFCEMGGPHATKLDVFGASTRRQKSGWGVSVGWQAPSGPNGMIHWVMGEVCAHPEVAKVPHHQTTASLKAVWQQHFWLKPDIFLTWNILKWYINIHHGDIS